jgi:hypothetical protein
MTGRFREGPWREWYEVNAMGLSSYALARGRYEIAQELHTIGTEWYEREVVKKRDPNDTAKDRRQYRELLAEYKSRLSEFPLLVATRSRLIESLRRYPQGIDRNKLKGEIGHGGTTTFGVISNQLARGGWIRQEKEGKSFMLYPENRPPTGDDLFIKAELPTPQRPDGAAGDERPLVKLPDQARPIRRPGCLSTVLGLIMLGGYALWLIGSS